MAAQCVAAADQAGDQHQPGRDGSESVVDRVNDAACAQQPVHVPSPRRSAINSGAVILWPKGSPAPRWLQAAASLGGGTTYQPPVTLMWRGSAGPLWRRSIMKSCPLGLRVIASSIAASSRSLPSEARSGLRKSAASSWPRHM